MLLGETIREIGILVFVFVPLDASFAYGRLQPGVLGGTIAAALVIIAAGIMPECKA